MGGYFRDVIIVVIRLLEAIPFLRRVLPWGPLLASLIKLDRPEESDVGQTLGTNVSALERGIVEETRTVCSIMSVMILFFIYFRFSCCLRIGRNEVQSLSWRTRASQPRETLFEDRTP